ncbi:MAG: hypothetical protein J6M39_09970 [Lachnospiraceae bacterium]|nr:hypothetical protein [Lachnospiraceae bacterium]
MVIDKEQLKKFLTIALFTIVICFISVMVSLGDFGLGGVLITLFVIFVIVNLVFYLISESNEKFKDAYSLSLIGTVAIPSITVVAYLIVKNLK